VSSPVIDELELAIHQLTSDSLKRQLEGVAALVAAGEKGASKLMAFVLSPLNLEPTVVRGAAYQALYHSTVVGIQTQLLAALPQGIVALPAAGKLDYQPLQTLLIAQDYQAADRLTSQYLCELAGTGAVQRKWVYFTEVDQFPVVDLQTIDLLWRVYSQGRFGFSCQRELWLNLNQDWERLWDLLDWRSQGRWTRYPDGFQWDLSAPIGHLPLSNQLRGVRMMESLLSHPAWG
jgi:GUN4-like/ARM-like repeat domain, GUN4-N terminal